MGISLSTSRPQQPHLSFPLEQSTSIPCLQPVANRSSCTHGSITSSPYVQCFSVPHSSTLSLAPLGPRDSLYALLTVARDRDDSNAPGAESIIRERLARVLAGIECVSANAVAAKEAVGACLAAALAEASDSDTVRAAEDAAASLHASIDREASVKTALFETEAVALESSLDRAAAVLTQVLAAVDDADASGAALSEAFAALAALLPSLSSSLPGEMETLYISPCPASTLPCAAAAAGSGSAARTPLGCRLVAPSALSPSLVVASPIPSRVCYGEGLRLTLAAPEAPPHWGDEEWAAALPHLASHVRVAAWHRTAAAGEPQRGLRPTDLLPVSIAADVPARTLSVTVTAPQPPLLPGPSGPRRSEAAEAEVCLFVAAAGVPLWGAPQQLRLYEGGLRAPLTLMRIPGEKQTTLMYPTPAVARDGRVFVPIAGGDVLVWDGNGEPLPPITQHKTSDPHSVAVDDESQTMLLSGTALIALDLRDPYGPPKWSHRGFTAGEKFNGVVAFPHHGVFVATSKPKDSAWVLSAADGRIMAEAVGAVPSPYHVCADTDRGHLFTSNSSSPPRAYEWVARKSRLVSLGSLPRLEGGNFRPMAYMPPCSVSAAGIADAAGGGGGLPACLVVASWGSSRLLVLTLPDHRVIHRHDVMEADRDGESMKKASVRGLACDPCGNALVVCTCGVRALVLPWPLEGCPRALTAPHPPR